MLNRFKSALLNVVGGSELGIQYPNDSDNETLTDYLNSNICAEIENKPYSRPSFLGLTTEETQVCALNYHYQYYDIEITIWNSDYLYNS